MMGLPAPYVLFIWSDLILRIFLVVSVVVLAFYIFVLHGRYLLARYRLKQSLKMEWPCDREDHSDDLKKKLLDKEALRLRRLMILWVAITVVSTVLFITFR